MISLVFVVVAAFLNACMDKHVYHYDLSLFSTWKHEFFAFDGWRNKYVDRSYVKGRKKFKGVNIHPAFLDVWHFCKSGMVIMICLAVILYNPMVNWYVDLLILGTAWNLTFTLFWSKLLVKK